ncbi:MULTISPECIES: nitrate reductase molybdenum cofactor assembly chaperone [unclassified Mesorhizobium]|uniref:nitrate reductase molybdenum cofactor assembly chaperone n=1 Tax=unclassified Mesorhizobium TaxID=325217 RepID=UPI001093E897|nr:MULTISPECIES: nitrate reductase molybdenum cofactor assembly chaperone [unclassified Mesorhizobium]TGQ72922.1 nitrate reductase molybdenum cofactor assembly chaperone [bacterium M00.F.Ca.ET.205.01.1.1]TGU53679.1 nitrate reductase molybdenum cofactor assembly chaperone [bacterium M00.F.Ca.ET.152.01.1.1]TGV37177.1 nitrate reductase molybdenum cofactor assembly chaperone [Mesorhizobium sp. M00.F.Ca.ET.186.01.1.1]TGZ39454.1 nitrate reductase molybdenum cofactor assembly chaperone [bacterium M00.
MSDPISNRTFRALSALLAYPTEDLSSAIPEITAAIEAEGLISVEAREQLRPLLADLGTLDLYDLQERYVELFDKTRRHSLHLFEHIHGESRDRGQAMVDLLEHYQRGGLLIAANELPDFIPLFLEFLSARPLEEARGLLKETAHIFSLLEERLAQRTGGYAAVFTAALSIINETAVVAGTVEINDEPDDLASIDAAWEEAAVTFGPGNATDGCSVDRLRIQMRAANRDARHNVA